jgi:putative FmdB family regulatory protein
LKALQRPSLIQTFMPIYAYKCESCGFAKDVLQKMSDAPLEVCPACAQSSFKKQLTAAGFQLKGSGWYATDFKGGGTASPTSAAPADAGTASASAAADAPKADTTPNTPTTKSDSTS